MSGEHYFSAEPAVANRPRTISFAAAGREFDLVAEAGVFSAGRLDPGTAVLLRKASLAPSSGPLLDLGCGYGPIACVLAATSPAATVYAVDVNERALRLVAENAERVGAAGRVRPLRPEQVPDDVWFEQIWSNPPIRIGKDDLHRMLLTWLPRLRPGGTAWLVIAKHLGGDSLQRWIAEQGWSVTREASQKGYRVLRVAGLSDPGQ